MFCIYTQNKTKQEHTQEHTHAKKKKGSVSNGDCYPTIQARWPGFVQQSPGKGGMREPIPQSHSFTSTHVDDVQTPHTLYTQVFKNLKAVSPREKAELYCYKGSSRGWEVEAENSLTTASLCYIRSCHKTKKKGSPSYLSNKKYSIIFFSREVQTRVDFSFNFVVSEFLHQSPAHLCQPLFLLWCLNLFPSFSLKQFLENIIVRAGDIAQSVRWSCQFRGINSNHGNKPLDQAVRGF